MVGQSQLEIGIEQLMPSGSGQQQTLQSGEDIVKLWQAATHGKWKDAVGCLDNHPEALTSTIEEPGMTLLHVAARAGNSDFILNLLDRLRPGDIERKDGYGNNALHYIVKVGKVEVARKMVRKNKELLESLDGRGNTPLMLATEWGVEARKAMVKFLAVSTPKAAFPKEVIFRITAAGFHDICLVVLHDNPDLVLHVAKAELVSSKEDTILMIMAKYYSLFTRGKFGYWEPLCQPESRKILLYHEHRRLTDSLELVKLICEEVARLDDKQVKDSYLDGLVPAVHLATKNGILELVAIWLNYFPKTIWTVHQDRLLFHVAVEYRQLDIFRYLIDLAGEAKYSIFKLKVDDDKKSSSNTNILHLAAKKAAYEQLRSVSGTALQLQREFQWFKMIEELVPNECKLALDKDGKTPRELFTLEHETLHNEAKEWMKSTSENCMVVATLVAGVVFSAMIQLPGGLNSDGNPNFLGSIPFSAFTIANGLALFSSLTSLLLFLAIQTSPYAEDDFAGSLPHKLMGGLFMLFFAISATVVAFAAALQIAVSSQFKWIYIVSMVFGWIPLYFFGRFQLPLFCEMLKSTFRGNIVLGQTHRERWWNRFFRLKTSSQV